LSAFIDYEIRTAQELRYAILNFVKPDPLKERYNLHDELQRILINPKLGVESRYRDYLNRMSTDLNNSLFKETPRDKHIQFVDLYTQIIVFSLFMGWIKYNATKIKGKSAVFVIEGIIDTLPNDSLITNLLRIEKMPKQLRKRIIRPLEHCFRSCDYNEIMKDIKHVYGQFYSDFLQEYDKKTADAMGVVNTPDEVISFIVRGTDYFLQNKTWFIDNKLITFENGIMDKRVFFLDPASGTMGFSVMMMKIVRERIKTDLMKSSVNREIPEDELEVKVRQQFNDWIFEKTPSLNYLAEEKEVNYLKKQYFFLENVFAFELLVSPYVLGYLNVLNEAEQMGAKINYSIHKPQLFLTNTLIDNPEEISLPKTGKIDRRKLSKEKKDPLRSYSKIKDSTLKTEISRSLRIRHDARIMVIWGNPPYNVSTQNTTPWITKLTQEYTHPSLMTREKGKPSIKSITGLKSMQDDALKFHRFAQWKITENNDQGIVAYISNSYFIDGKAARGMRKVLRIVYDEIWVVNLFGNKEKGIPHRLRQEGIHTDENIFPQGCTRSVAITFMIRYPPKKHAEHKENNEMNCKIYYIEKAGYRQNNFGEKGPIRNRNYLDKSGKLILGKFEWLENNSIDSIDWIEVGERLDHEFVPKIDEDKKEQLYNTFPDLNGIFIENMVGIVTGQDTLVSNIDKQRLKDNLKRFYNRDFNDKFMPFYFIDHKKKKVEGSKYKDKELEFNDNRDWKIDQAINSDPKKAEERIMKWVWRGFDIRYVSYYRPLIKRGTDQYRIMQFLLPEQNNITINLDRGIHCGVDSNIALVSRYIVEHKATSYSTGKGTATFPLKINKTDMRNDISENPKKVVDSNINPKFKDLLDYEVADSEIFYYIYAILYTERYREEFFEFLRDDFPRLPFPKEKSFFDRVTFYGKRLAKLHLFLENSEKDTLDRSTSIFELLDSGLDDELKLSDTTYNKNANDPQHRQLKHVTYEGDEKNPITDIKIQQKDQLGNWKKFKIYFDKSKKKNKDETFWIDGVTRPIWDYSLGGRKQIFEWLQKRRYTEPETPRRNHITHELRHNKDEIEYLRLMISAIKNTLTIQNDLNKLYLQIKGNFIRFDIETLNNLIELTAKRKMQF